LTELVNRREFERRLAHALEGYQRFGALHTLCYLDLDQFKVVNDTAGHLAGDELLRQVAGLLSQLVRERDTLARLGGDEFGLLLDNCPVSKAEQIAANIIAHLRDFRFQWQGRSFQIGVSIGIAPLIDEVVDGMQLMTRADIACYAAKKQGRNRFHVYAAVDESSRQQAELLRAADLREALDNNRFRLWLQAAVPLDQQSHQPRLCEVLLRLIDADGNVCNPNSFIPAAERHNVMRDIDRWVVTNVLSNFQAITGADMDCAVSINLSGNSLSDNGLLEFLQTALDEAGVPAENICFEISETVAVQNLSQARRLIQALRERGCKFALDDFGGEFSSFSYLRQLPIDYLKISGDFVQGMLSDNIDQAFVEAINHIGHTMRLKIIAEQVEHSDLVEKLRELGVDYLQGYAVGRPVQVEMANMQTV
jgi:diguanylate cyclase (GGDEF)-like protein